MTNECFAQRAKASVGTGRGSRNQEARHADADACPVNLSNVWTLGAEATGRHGVT